MHAPRLAARVVAVALAAGVFAAPAAAVTKHPAIPPAAAADDERRVTVALMGDSLAEGAYLPDPAVQGLGPRLRATLSADGWDPGGRGFVPAHPATLSARSEPLRAWPVEFTGAWTASTGLEGGARSVLESRSQGAARATLRVQGDAVAALFSAAPGVSSLTVRAGDQVVRIGPDDLVGGLQMAFVDASRASRVAVDVHRGPMRLMGFFERRRVRSRPQVELSLLVRGGARGADAIGPLDEAGIDILRPRLTLLAYGTNDGLQAAWGDTGALSRMADGLRALARRARRTGRCVVVLPPRAMPTASVAAAVDAELRQVAAAEGCGVSGVLQRVLDGPGARLSDGIHPSPSGVRRMARALRPLLSRPSAPTSAR